MKKHITLALFIAVLLGVLSIGCNKQPSEKTSVVEPSMVEMVEPSEKTSVGDTIVFGHEYGIPIMWYVLDKDKLNHRLMLLAMSEWAIFPYHEESEAVTWAGSTIRSWLNGYGSNQNKQRKDYTSVNFIKRVFTNEERARIAKLKVVNENNPEYGTPGGMNTQDQVFLLSIAEVETLLGEDICTKISCTTEWWLRSPGIHTDRAASVLFSRHANRGIIFREGSEVSNSHVGVRPALWLNY